MTKGSGIKYRRFAPDAGRSVGGAAQVDERARFEEIIARARGRARADGFEEGVAQAEAEIDRSLMQQLSAISEALEEASRQSDALEAMIRAKICEALSSFISEIAPQLANIGAVSAIVDAFDDSAGAVSPPRPIVRIGPEASDATTTALRNAEIDAEVDVDPTLEPGCVRINWRGGFDEIDLRPAVRSALAVLAQVFETADQSTNIDREAGT